MAKNSYRRQVGGLTPKGDRITIGRVSSNADSVRNARAKGCFGPAGVNMPKREKFNRRR